MSHHAELDAAISDWTTQYDHNEVTAILQRASVPVGPVLANWGLRPLYEQWTIADEPYPDLPAPMSPPR